MSAAAGAGLVALLYVLLGTFGIYGWLRLLWIACIQLHAHFWYLSASGVAEVPLMLVMVAFVLALCSPMQPTLRLCWRSRVGSRACSFVTKRWL